jgi:hypothetical protein
VPSRGFGSCLQEEVGPFLRPLHLLLFGEASADDEVDGGFHEGGGNPFTVVPASAVIDDRRGVVGDVGGQSGGRLNQPLQPG